MSDMREFELRQKKPDVFLMDELRRDLCGAGYGNIRLMSDDAVIDLFVLLKRSFDEQFVLSDRAGKPLADVLYTAQFSSGRIVHGKTDGRGRTERFATLGRETIKIYLGHREL
jgi:hypothetical protein